jgi:enamine deaminase RidA (YjgF/YER057c/UK114 family)
MQLKAVNPWSWQDSLHFSHAVEAPGANRVVFLAGQTSVDPEGRPLYANDMAAQLERAFENLELVLEHAGFTLANLVRLNYYVTDMAAYANARGVVAAKLGALAVKPSGCLLGVTCLAHPDLMIEIEATAVGCALPSNATRL